MNRILVIRGGAIGDFILTLPAIGLLREKYPRAHLEVLGYENIVALAKMSRQVDATRSIEAAALAGFFVAGGELPRDWAEYFAGFDLVLSYLFDPDGIFAHNLERAGVPRLIVGSPRIQPGEHAARQLARPLEQLDLHLTNPAPRLLPNEPRKARQNLIALHPGSGSEAKNWPFDRWLALSATLLQADDERRILFLIGEAEEERLGRRLVKLPEDRIELVRNRPLSEVAAKLQNCVLFLGHDSGISHLAAAVGSPCILLFGPSDPAIWAPLNSRVKILRAPSQTMSGIALAEVLEAVRQELMRIGIRT